jgi:hypothetical protein
VTRRRDAAEPETIGKSGGVNSHGRGPGLRRRPVGPPRLLSNHDAFLGYHYDPIIGLGSRAGPAGGPLTLALSLSLRHSGDSSSRA